MSRSVVSLLIRYHVEQGRGRALSGSGRPLARTSAGLARCEIRREEREKPERAQTYPTYPGISAAKQKKNTAKKKGAGRNGLAAQVLVSRATMLLLQRATSARAARRVVSGAARLRAQCYSTSLADVELAAPQPAPLCALLEEEQAMAEAASRFARERVGPVVQSMDEACGGRSRRVIGGPAFRGPRFLCIGGQDGGRRDRRAL